MKRTGRTASSGLAVVVLALALPWASIAQERQVHYLPAGEPNGVELLAPPPLPGSAEQKADMATTIEVFKWRTASDEVLGKSEKKVTVFIFGRVVGPFFQAEHLPKTEAFFREVSKEAGAVTEAAKNSFKRPRPYVTEPSLAASTNEMEKSFSYPSGHSTRATVIALVLAEMCPEKREAILGVGRDIGWHRVELARHYPTDIYAGRTLARAIVRQLRQNPAFGHDFAEAKAEINAAQERVSSQAAK